MKRWILQSMILAGGLLAAVHAPAEETDARCSLALPGMGEVSLPTGPGSGTSRPSGRCVPMATSAGA